MRDSSEVQERLGPFLIDLFAAETSAQFPLYCIWCPDPAALAVDALSIPWTKCFPYMFPPFTLILRCLNKIHREQVSAVIVAPAWSNQLWFPQLLSSLADYLILFPALPEIVNSPGDSHHSLAVQGHLPLAACPVPGEKVALEAFLNKLSMSSRDLGGSQLNRLTPMHGRSGIAGALNGVLIPFQLL